MAVIKNRACEGGDEFWDHVEHIAAITPWPWEAVADLDGDHAIWAGDVLVAVTDGWEYSTTRHAGLDKPFRRERSEDEANARLIAAAPEMLGEILSFVKRHHIEAKAVNFKTCGCDDCNKFKAVILKARGV